MKKRIVTFHATSTIFPIMVGYYYGPFREEVLREFAKSLELMDKNDNREFVPPRNGADGATCYNLNGGSIIWMPHWPRSDADKAMLVHECVHAVAFNAREMGFEQVSESEEFYCYMTQWLFLCGLTLPTKGKN